MIVAAVVLAAGESRRMGTPKMALPWGATTVLGQVLHVLQAAEVEDILVVTGAAREAVEAICNAECVRAVFNKAFHGGEMLASLQTGLRATRAAAAVLVVLGDQPQSQEDTVRLVVQRYAASGSALVVPSHERRRGHPWLVDRTLWPELLAMKAPATPRDFLDHHAAEIRYVELDSPAILTDVDTPDEYLKARPKPPTPEPNTPQGEVTR
jgi:molybdenum cofactor cytidylyltransferase